MKVLTQHHRPKPDVHVKVLVPATAANIGSGFDVLGLALDHHNEVELRGWRRALSPRFVVHIDGEGSSTLPVNRTNLVVRMVRKTMERLKADVETIEIRLVNRIPLSRGLGSSSAAIVGGIVAANAAFGRRLSVQDMMDMAVAEEGHPDNVVPALVGGLCVAARTPRGTRYAAWKDARLFRDLKAVMCMPDFELSTDKAREILPECVNREDAVFNSARVGLLLSALHFRQPTLLADAMEDRLHQPYRRRLVPGFEDVLHSARKAGAWGAALSGAGPSVMALAPSRKAQGVGDAMGAAFRRHGVSSMPLCLNVDLKGARVRVLH
jgi:homoserine kinase